MPDVLVAGHVNWDVTLVVDRLPAADEESPIRERHRGGGGSAANVAAGLTALSVEPSLLGSVGDDEPGRLAREALAERGVDVEDVRITRGETSTKYLLVAGEDVGVLGLDGVNEALRPDDVGPDDVADVEHVHLTGQRVATAERLAELATAAGCTVSLDPGRRADERDYADVLEHVDLAFGTDREIAALFDGTGANAHMDELLVVETSGAGGAACAVPGGGEQSHPGFEVDVVDTTGAGDAFVAGFLSVWLDSEAYGRALKVGNACGAIASRQVGARSDLDPDVLASFLE
ncbi:carbohydrate kinase family protein [Salinarchaeum chitinilyticum]